MSERPAFGAREVAKSLGVQALLLAALPANLLVTATVGVYAMVAGERVEVPEQPRTVLLSGGKMTKALHLARTFHRAGHRVILVESSHYRFTGHRFSRCVDHFYLVPSPGHPDYVPALIDIVRSEQVDVYVPVCSPASSFDDAQVQAALGSACDVIHVDPDTLRVVDDKYAFAQAAQEMGLAVPQTHLITDPQQVLDFDFSHQRRPYVLKSIAYDPVHRLDLTLLPRPRAAQTSAYVHSLPISADNPWILQEFITGTEYCTHGTVRDGELTAYCCCESSAFQVNYDALDKPQIERWVRRFTRALGVTGQLSFDFIEDADGTAYAIECNPRPHSAITLFHDPVALSRAYLGGGAAMLRPAPTGRATYWTYHEWWRVLAHPRTAVTRLRVLMRGRDAIFDAHDPLPFLAVHHLQIPVLLLANLRARRDFVRVDMNIGKLVEPGGD